MTPPYVSGLMLSACLLLPASALAQAPSPAPPAWNYSGGGNDDEGWGALSHDYATCDIGTGQSPVGINAAEASTMPPLHIAYGRMAAHIQHKERTLVVEADGKYSVRADGHEYRLVELRMHTPAEHSVRDSLYPFELHFIHHNDEGKILITAVLFKVGAANEALQTLLDKAPDTPGAAVGVTFNADALLPKTRGYFAYSGSLSWPPCTEGVEWRVFKTPLTLSHDQLKTLGILLKRNARVLQPLYLRTIKATID